MLNNKKNMKKGNLDDIGQIAFILLSIFFAMFIMGTIGDRFITSFRNNTATNYTEVLDNAETFRTRSDQAWDYGALFLAVIVLIFSYITASKIQINTKVGIIAIIILAFYLILSLVVSNIYGQSTDNSLIGAFAGNLTYIPILLRYLPYYSLIHIIVIMVGLYGKQE